MAHITHTLSHHVHGEVRVKIFDHDDAILVRLYPAGKNDLIHGVDIFFHRATDNQRVAFKALAAALAAQDAPATEEV